MFGIVLKGERGDFIIEVKNRRINMWLFIGVLDKWFNVCMCVDKLEKVNKKKEKKILFLFFIYFDVFVFIYLCIFIVMFVILKFFVF